VVTSEGGLVVQLRDVSKAYGKVPALSGLDLSVRRGQVYGLLGRNGAGKSTALRLIMGITRPDRGGIELFGRETARESVKLRQRVGYVAQEQHFYEWMTPQRLGRFVAGFAQRGITRGTSSCSRASRSPLEISARSRAAPR
jgi:ABC-type multidrug transport system ATPase subunit